MLRLIHSIQHDGWNHEHDFSIGNITIGKNGELHKSNVGDHRFIIAIILGVNPIPFRVKGIHESYAKIKVS